MTAFGGSGGSDSSLNFFGGSGARLSAVFYLDAGDLLCVAIGGGGTSAACVGGGGSGGGATIIGTQEQPYHIPSPLLVAGGGGGSGIAMAGYGADPNSSDGGHGSGFER
jgi:hypothetical protein